MNWPTSALGEVIKIDRISVQPEHIRSGTLYVGLENISKDGIFNNVGYVQNGDLASSKFSFTQDNVLFGKLRPYLRKIIRPGFSGVCSTDILPLRAGSRVDKNYLYHWLLLPETVNLAASRSSGANLPRLNPSTLLEFQIPLPPLAEQKRIGAILDEADALRHKRREVITKFDTLLQSVFLENFGDPVENSKAWEKATIADLVQDVSYGTSSLAGSEGEFPILRMGNITYAGGWDFTNLKYIDLTDKEQHKYLVRRGDLLFNRTNSKELVGKTAVYRRAEPMAYAGYLIRVRPKPEHSSEYISAYLNSVHGKQVLRKMCKSIIGMANINASELKSIQILVPRSSFQKDYEKRAAAIYAMREDAEASLSQMEVLFTTLQYQAFHSKPNGNIATQSPTTPPCLTLDF